MYFTECDNYMDGGVLANNPSLLAWTLIQTYHDNYHLPKPKVAMAVSLGTGRYPSQKLGETDILGKGLLNLKGTMKRAQRFIKMISTAVGCKGTVPNFLFKSFITFLLSWLSQRVWLAPSTPLAKRWISNSSDLVPHCHQSFHLMKLISRSA